MPIVFAMSGDKRTGLISKKKPKLLVLELWGLGDLTFSTPFLDRAQETYEVHLLGKPHARQLLEPTFPDIRFHAYDAPWTRFRGKYDIWRWHWGEMASVILRLRKERFSSVVSVRNDPRDHVLMWMLNIPNRHGFPKLGSQVFLSRQMRRASPRQHRVEDWYDIGESFGFAGIRRVAPHLTPPESGHLSGELSLLKRDGKPLICLHAGARIGVRRWPEEYFAEIVRRMRREFDFHLALVPDTDGYGIGLSSLAEMTFPKLSIPELTELLHGTDMLLCNDSGPSHIAACLEKPVIALFGPSDSGWFRPWGDRHLIIEQDICPWKPCSDYCKFPEPYCMTKLLPENVWKKIRDFLERLIVGSRNAGTSELDVIEGTTE